jgi:hypothetical protein
VLVDQLGEWWDERPLQVIGVALLLVFAVVVLAAVFVLGVRQSRRNDETWPSALVDGVVEWYRLAWVFLTFGRAEVHLAAEDSAPIAWLSQKLNPGGQPPGRKRLHSRLR